MAVASVLHKSSVPFVWIRGSRLLSEAICQGCALDHMPLHFLGVGWKPDCFPRGQGKGLNWMAGPGAQCGAGAEACATASGQGHCQTLATSVLR